MQELVLHVASEIVDGIETLWVTSDSTAINLDIDVSTGVVRRFSCRLGPGVVAEMGETRDTTLGHVYPSLCIFTEDENHNTSRQQFCTKVDDNWSIEY